MSKPEYVNCFNSAANRDLQEAVITFFHSVPELNEKGDIIGVETTEVFRAVMTEYALRQLAGVIDSALALFENKQIEE